MTIAGETNTERATPEGLPPFLRDIPVSISVEIGKATLTMEDLLALQEHSLVELANTDQPAVLIAGGRPVAHVELVVMEDQLAARVLEILEDPATEA